MAIDRAHLTRLLEQVDALLEQVPGEALRRQLRSTVFGPALDDLKALVSESRPPVLYVTGRSGDGKSSLLNALAGRDVAVVGHIAPTTALAEEHVIDFAAGVAWRVWDSRGFFESTRPAGAAPVDALALVADDLASKRPDIVCHVVASPQLRSFSEDLRAMTQIAAEAKRRSGGMPPMVMVLTKPDIEGRPAEWPPEIYPEKARLLEERLAYGAELLGCAPLAPLRIQRPWHGGLARRGPYAALVPVKVLPGDVPWNVDTLRGVIGDRLPTSAQLQLQQATRDAALARQICERVITSFSVAAGGVAALPIPLEDVFLIAPLQLVMVAFIGAMAGRSLSQKTVLEFLAAAGLSVSGGLVLRQVAGTLMKLVPGAGSLVGAAIASTGTTAIGKSAVAYFFNGAAPTVS